LKTQKVREICQGGDWSKRESDTWLAKMTIIIHFPFSSRKLLTFRISRILASLTILQVNLIKTACKMPRYVKATGMPPSKGNNFIKVTESAHDMYFSYNWHSSSREVENVKV
jgi:hypothetical protein